MMKLKKTVKKISRVNMSNSWFELWDRDKQIKKNKTNYEAQFSINPVLKDEKNNN
jgi:hypothetical protein